MRRGPWLLSAGVLACSTGSEVPSADRVVIVDVSAAALDPATLRVVPAAAARRVVVSDASVSVSFAGAAPPFEVQLDGACPVRVEPARTAPGAASHAAAQPLFEYGAADRVVGYDRPFSVELAPRCPEAARTTVSWRQIDGPPLPELRVSADGRRVSGRSAPLPERYRRQVPWGVVPVSAAEQAEATLEASVGRARFRVRIAAAHRSRGLANVAVGTRLLLGGSGWKVAEAPVAAGPALTPEPPFTVFEPAIGGRYRLEDAAGRTLTLLSGRYDETPLDCGRAECHASTARSALVSPMSSALGRGLSAATSPAYPECAFGCHTLGERSADDGGFAHVLRELALPAASLSRLSWNELPRSLRRLGSVGCLGCHGPGTTPEPESRAALLESDVCATCHDAPPRYAHAAAWNTTRMARGRPETVAAECARCHTTAGFLHAQGVRAQAPADRPGAGLDCVACHAPHEHGRDAGPAPALLRTVDVVPELAGVALGAAAICVPCHTTRAGDGSVAASSALIWAGRGGLRPHDGAPLRGEAGHMAVEGACLGCHRAGPGAFGAGAAHGFAIDAASCAGCHAVPPSDAGGAALRARAERLFAAFTGEVQPEQPPHARARPNVPADTPRARALHDVLLVLEDRAAFEHNAKYATLLLDSAEATLARDEVR